MSTAKNILAVVLGILVLILVVLLARWVGDKIKERFTTPKTVVTTNPPVETVPNTTTTNPEASPTPVTYKAIPKTGPEFVYLFTGLSTLAGVISLKFSKKISK